jgi:hypothetical protein
MAGAENDAEDAPDGRSSQCNGGRAFDGVAKVGEELLHDYCVLLVNG